MIAVGIGITAEATNMPVRSPAETIHKYLQGKIYICHWEIWFQVSTQVPRKKERFQDKCNGFPITIASIGVMLSWKTPCFAEWQKVYDVLELHLVKTLMPPVKTILKFNLEDLPYDLKNCFLHCALFPE